MASTVQHMAIAIEINTRFLNFKDDNLIQYFLGAIVCDAPKLDFNKTLSSTYKKLPDTMERKSERAYTHFLRPSKNLDKKNDFIDIEIAKKYGYNAVDDSPTSPVCFEEFCPMLNYFISKYKTYFKEPFMIGYLVHLITDDIYFSKIMSTISNDKLYEIEKYITNKYSLIEYQKKPYLTNGEYLDWSHFAMYNDYDKYNSILIHKYFSEFPDFYYLSKYLQNWNDSNTDFNPWVIEELNDIKSMRYFIENSNNTAKNIRELKNKINNSTINQEMISSLEVLTPEYYKMLEDKTIDKFIEIYNKINN